MSDNSRKLVSIGLVILLIGVGGWYFFIKPIQEFDDELKYYMALENQRSDVVYLDFEDGELNEYLSDSFNRFCSKQCGKQELRILIQEAIEEAEFFKVRIIVDKKSKAIILDDMVTYSYWMA